MMDLVEPSFSASERVVLDEIGRRLRARGWAVHVTVAVLLRDWQSLSNSVDRYAATVDDYTNNCTARDGLEIVLADCPESLRTKLRLATETAEKEFLGRTQKDVERTLERCFRIDKSSAP